MRPYLLVGILALATMAGCLSEESDENNPSFDVDENAPPVVVVAVIDFGFNPYHQDFLASTMPQHQDALASNDLPLDQDPATWLPNHPGADAFSSYERMDLSLTDDPEAKSNDLRAQDDDAWNSVTSSTVDNVHMKWIPDSKIVGYVTFGGGGYGRTSHGAGSMSVSTGNLFGTCPNCVVVFVDGASEGANEWVQQQDWIDVQTNSWGYSQTGVIRDRFYAGSDVEGQREAVERGQAIFFSAGNGLGNTFTAPNPTLFSSQEGPDWITTVGAITPSDGASYTGHGKPADIASVGSSYPAGRSGDGTTVEEGTFGGTSSATPTTAGMYAQALYRIRSEGAGRIQDNGTIAVGLPGCGEANPECPTADGQLTFKELRDTLYAAAQHTDAGYSPAGVATLPETDGKELTFLAEGHGSFEARLNSDDVWADEVQRIVDLVFGHAVAEIDQDLVDWSAALSYCRQALWGTWDMGHDQLGVPGPDPAWPVRDWFTEMCPVVGPPIIAANEVVTEANPLN